MSAFEDIETKSNSFLKQFFGGTRNMKVSDVHVVIFIKSARASSKYQET